MVATPSRWSSIIASRSVIYFRKMYFIDLLAHLQEHEVQKYQPSFPYWLAVLLLTLMTKNILTMPIYIIPIYKIVNCMQFIKVLKHTN